MITINIQLASYGIADGTFIPAFNLFENQGPTTNLSKFSYNNEPRASEKEANEVAKNGALIHIHEHYPEGTKYAIDEIPKN